MMAQNNQSKQIDEADRLYEANGGHLTLFNEFRRDQLTGNEQLITIRMERFYEQWPSFDNIFHATMNSNNTLFRDGLLGHDK